MIHFYSTRGEYGCFSNFSRHSFLLDGIRYRTAEHYFQSKKAANVEQELAIRNAPTPTAAAALGRACQLHANWNQLRDAVMKRALLAKFSQNRAALETLLGTGNNVLVEHTARDNYWGDGGGGGRNRLGELLMEVRAELRPQN